MKVKIYIATHKEIKMQNEEGYTPIQVGAEINKPLSYLKDNTGDNISAKNKNYCELTALYWIWKNTSEDIVGLTHYRMFFYKNIFSKKVLKIEDIEKILNKYDIILPSKVNINMTIEEHYKKYHHIEDLFKCRDIIDDIYPEYTEAFDKIIKRKSLYAFNMFIMKKNRFNEYMTWLFKIFEKLEKIVDISNYDEYNKRIYGFLSERLFNVWIENQKLKEKEMLVLNVEENRGKQIKGYLKNLIKNN